MTVPDPERCITCADEAVPMRVVRAGDDAVARCTDEAGCATERDVDVTLVAPVAPGDVLLVHAGVALLHLEDRR